MKWQTPSCTKQWYSTYYLSQCRAFICFYCLLHPFTFFFKSTFDYLLASVSFMLQFQSCFSLRPCFNFGPALVSVLLHLNPASVSVLLQFQSCFSFNPASVSICDNGLVEAQVCTVYQPNRFTVFQHSRKKNLRRSDTHNALSLFRRTSQCFAIIFSNNKDECTAIDSFSFNGSSVRSLRN